MFSFTSRQIGDIQTGALRLIQTYPSSKLFTFSGNMGAGKTTFIKAICKCLGVEEIVSSPTFSIINEYRTTTNSKIYHFDFYRIEKPEEAFDLGYEDYFFSNCFCFIEWPEKVKELIPKNSINIQIRMKGTERLITSSD